MVKMTNKEKTVSTTTKKTKAYSIFIITIVLLGIYMLFRVVSSSGIFDEVILSKYANKIYAVKSTDGKVDGTITTRVYACSENRSCVYADYYIVLNDVIPANNNNNLGIAGFDPNYYYVANILNNEFDDGKPSFDSKLVPIDKNFPSNKFTIRFNRALNDSYYSPDDFLKSNKLVIYDVSNPVNIDQELGFINDIAPSKGAVEFRSYDFTVSPQ